MKREKLQATTHIENKQGKCTHKPTKRIKKKVTTQIKRKQSPKLKSLFERKQNFELKTHQDDFF